MSPEHTSSILGGNDDFLNEQLRLNDATRASLTVVPNCGLAPGLLTIITAARARQFEEIDSIHLSVGCVPQYPWPLLNHRILSSLEGLLHAYASPCMVLQNGTLSHSAPPTEIETLSFPPTIISMEAFVTSGSLSELLRRRMAEAGKDVVLYRIEVRGRARNKTTL